MNAVSDNAFVCENCGDDSPSPAFGRRICTACASDLKNEQDEPDDMCSNPSGHEWTYTGSAYGGDDDSFHGEGRCYCVHCGADGDA